MNDYLYYLNENQSENTELPYVRLKSVKLNNFKGVKQGSIEFNSFKDDSPVDTTSDILGIYGQNGSGKSSVIEAISIVKLIMSGVSLEPDFVRNIDVSSDTAKIVLSFDFKYKSGKQFEVEYAAELSRCSKIDLSSADISQQKHIKEYIGISNESIRTSVYAGKTGYLRMHTVIDTKKNVFCSQSDLKYFFGDKHSEIANELFYIKRKSFDDSRSFVFSYDLSTLIKSTGAHSVYLELLAELQYFITSYLYVIKTGSNGIYQLRAGIPLYVPYGRMPVIISENNPIPKDLYPVICKTVSAVSVTINSIIPGMSIDMASVPTKLNDGTDGYYLSLYSMRDDVMIPLLCESDGIIRLISFISLYVMAFNQGSTTLIIDEIDSGIYEYLLGELLKSFEQFGKGQLIFTSHNLRPLEIIDRKNIRFTTSDPENRYYKIKNVRPEKNLRDVYLQEVQVPTQEIELYRPTKTFKFIKAIRLAEKELHDNA